MSPVAKAAIGSVRASASMAIEEHHATMDRLSQDASGFHRLSILLKELTGIYLNDSPKNRSLLVSRLATLLKGSAMSSLQDYYQHLRALPANHPDLQEFTSRLTTNTTRFFRESAHFKQLQRVLPEILAEKATMAGVDGSELRVWCAASSTGQEPYTIAMVIEEELARISPRKQWRVKVLASDIDRPSLQKAVSGVYIEQEMDGVPPEYQAKYFVQRLDPSGRKSYAIHPELAKKLTFTEINLTQQPYPMQRKFDVIFCRNVLIYFDRETSHQVVANLGRVLRPGGFLFLGHSESGSMRHGEFETISHAMYRKRRGGK